MTTPTSFDTTSTTERDERKRKKAAIVKYSLAGVALLGIGAAMTSATWTDNAWFRADANAVNPDTAIDLRGGLTEDGTFLEADASGTGVAVEVPAAVFQDLTAGDTVETTLWLWNAGTHDLQIAAPEVYIDSEATPFDPATDAFGPAGGLFAEGGAVVEVVGAPSALPSADGEDKEPFTVRISLADGADRSFGGKTGTVLVKFQGSIENQTVTP